MSCSECERLRALLSPLEDKAFTTLYLQHEPDAWIRTQRALRLGAPHVKVTLVELWANTFFTPHTALDLTKLGRTLQALGWSRTKMDGRLYFVRPL